MIGASYIQPNLRGTMSVPTTERAVLPTVATPTDTEKLLVSCRYGNVNANIFLGVIVDSTYPPFGISVSVP